MVRKLTLAMLVSLSVCGATTVKLYFTALPTSYVNGTFNGFSTANVAGIDNQLLLCDDTKHNTYMATPVEDRPLTYDVIRFDGASVVGLMYADRGVTVYKQAAVLLYQFVNVAGGMSASGDTVANYQYAIWNLMNPDWALYQPVPEQLLQANALAMVQNGNPAVMGPIYSSMLVYTPASVSMPNQEFLQLTPEPGTSWLLACALGMGGVVMGFRRLRRPAR